MRDSTIHFDNANEAREIDAALENLLAGIERNVVRHPLVQKVIEAYQRKRSS